ncbi:glycosyltransferase [Chryseobacterium sp. RR2-3-20]|uniref:glycosyltransferase n=1 Tax=Chryseobacterium sp. RR2-3-20 TaxID=2787626 RepID=UPI001ADF88AD|nr:glycosyltransferase [Chryseobacterium sp. RR2-3-20]
MSNSYTIIDNTLPNPMVSVAMLAYNHEDYIEKAIESALIQKTNFSIQIVIAEDHSTDNTRNIILDYQKKYPKIIKLLLQNKNVGATQNNKDLFKALEGKYIAALEGDDYWIDENKIQKQVDILNANPNYSLCFTNAKVLNDDLIAINDKISNVESKTYKDTDLLNQWLIPTASTLFINSFTEKDYEILSHPDIIFGDIILFLVLANKGELIGLEDYTSVYRINNNSFTNKEKSITYYEKLFRHLNYLSVIFDGKYKPLIQSHINHQGYKLFKYYLSKYNFKAFNYIKYYFSHSS